MAGDDTTIEVKEGANDDQRLGEKDAVVAESASATRPGDLTAGGGDPEKAEPASSSLPAKPMLGVKTDEDGDNIVGWDGPDDPENPYNWPAWRKVANCGAISALTFVTPLTSCKSSRNAQPRPDI